MGPDQGYYQDRQHNPQNHGYGRFLDFQSDHFVSVPFFEKQHVAPRQEPDLSIDLVSMILDALSPAHKFDDVSGVECPDLDSDPMRA
jgi:hypothetical protein